MGKLNWRVWPFPIAIAKANQNHKWANSAPHENGRIAPGLQRRKLLQIQRQHAKHPGAKKDSYCCSITNYRNPILEELEFWKLLERFNKHWLGLERSAE